MKLTIKADFCKNVTYIQPQVQGHANNTSENRILGLNRVHCVQIETQMNTMNNFGCMRRILSICTSLTATGPTPYKRYHRLAVCQGPVLHFSDVRGVSLNSSHVRYYVIRAFASFIVSYNLFLSDFIRDLIINHWLVSSDGYFQ